MLVIFTHPFINLTKVSSFSFAHLFTLFKLCFIFNLKTVSPQRKVTSAAANKTDRPTSKNRKTRSSSENQFVFELENEYVYFLLRFILNDYTTGK